MSRAESGLTPAFAAILTFPLPTDHFGGRSAPPPQRGSSMLRGKKGPMAWLVWAAILQAATGTPLFVPASPCTPSKLGSYAGPHEAANTVKLHKQNDSFMSKCMARWIRKAEERAARDAHDPLATADDPQWLTQAKEEFAASKAAGAPAGSSIF